MNRKGFTLIELLIVIAIIGILAALIIVSLTGARGKAQDTQRKNNARNLDTALEQYYVDKNGKYPGDTVATASTGQSVDTTGTGACSGTAGAGIAFNQNATSDTLFGTYGYIANTTVCNDPTTLPRFYATDVDTAGPNATKFQIAWQLASQSETVATSGNGIYAAAANIVTVNGIANTIAGSGTLKHFVVYGPQ
jgi:prepilin-type N-terminal cleavage/methylation domain-containing protein